MRLTQTQLFPDATFLAPAPDWIERLLCSHRSCDEPAAYTAPVGRNTARLCDLHAQEYERRYGLADLYAIQYNMPSKYHWLVR